MLLQYGVPPTSLKRQSIRSLEDQNLKRPENPNKRSNSFDLHKNIADMQFLSNVLNVTKT